MHLWRSRRGKGVAFCLVLLLLVGCSNSPSSPKAEGITADKNGALSVEASGYRFSAPPGTFDADQSLSIESLSGGLPELGNGRFIVPPVSVKTPSQPRRPVGFEVTINEHVDPNLTLAVAWTDMGDAGLLPFDIVGTTLKAQRRTSALLAFSNFPLWVMSKGG